VNGAELAQASEQGRQLIGPVKGSPKKKGMFPVESFDISIEERRAVCPAGHKSQTCCRIADYHPGATMFTINCFCEFITQRRPLRSSGSTSIDDTSRTSVMISSPVPAIWIS